MSIPTVSVVVATYNYGQYLAEALDSIRIQSFTDWETIVVDDGSTDNTRDVIEPYLQDPRFKYLRTEHVGQPAAKNTGIRAARGQFIAFLDADDVWLPTKLAEQMALFAADLRLGVAYSRRQVIDPAGHIRPFVEAPFHRGKVLRAMFRQNFVCFSSAVVRHDVFNSVGLFDEQLPLAIDYELWLRVALRYPFDFVDRPLVRYRSGHASLSRRGEERLQIVLEIMRRFSRRRKIWSVLGFCAIQQAFCETYCSLGLVQRDRSVWAAGASYLRALACNPLRLAPWRGIASLMLPESARRLLRRVLGRPVSWQEMAALSNVDTCAESLECSTTSLQTP